MSCDTSDQLQFENNRNRRGLCHLTEINIVAIQPLTLHDQFLAIAYFPVYKSQSVRNF